MSEVNKNGKNPEREVKVIVGVPVERNVNQKAFYGFIAIAQQGFPFVKVDYTRCDMARNKMSRHLLNSDFTHLLMLDSDHIHPQDIVHKLVQNFIENPEMLVCGGLNFRRGEPYDPCVFMKDDEGYYTLADWPRDEIFKVDILGSGSIMIAREVFEMLPEPWWAYSYDRVLEDQWPGVDIWFSKLCEEYKIDMYCDPRVSSPHIIDSFVTEEVYRHYLDATEGQRRTNEAEPSQIAT